MGKDIIDIIKEKKYTELSIEEKAEVSEFCSTEEEFDQMKSVFLSVEEFAVADTKPKAETKARLDDLFVATYPKASPMWYNSLLTLVVPKEKPFYRQPLVQLAAASLLLFLVFYLPGGRLNMESRQVAQHDSKVREEAVVESKPSVVNSPSLESENSESHTEELAEVSTRNDLLQSELEETETIVAFDAVFNEQSPVSSAPGLSSNHPDGIFVGSIGSEVSTSMSASESSELLDLLTATF